MRNRLRIAIVLWATVSALLISCRPSGRGEDLFRELEFRVDSSLIGEEIVLTGFGFCPPAGWNEADSALMSAVQKGLEQQAAGNPLPTLERVCLHGETGAVLVVTSFAETGDQPGGFPAWARSFVKGYRAASPKVPVEEDWLKIGGILAVQLYIADSARVLFKYLLAGDEVIGLDYSVPRGAWAEEMRAVESSVGTVKKGKSEKQKSES